MSKKSIPSKFTYTPSADLPKQKKNATSWNLKKHYYSSAKDGQIEKDAKRHEQVTLAFARKYRNKEYTNSAKALLAALKDYEVLSGEFLGAKVVRYFSFRTVLDVNDTEASKLLATYSDRFRKVSNELLFFTLKLGKIPKANQKKFLNDPSLAHYRYFLKQVFESAKFQLSEPEEKILRLTSNTSSGMWADATEKILGNRKVTFKGREYSVPEALENIDVQTWENKTKLWDLILIELKSVSEFAEQELSALVSYEKVSDELRGFEKPYSATILAYENDEKAVESLVEAISTKGFQQSRKYYKLKAKIHGLNTLPYANRNDPIGNIQQPSFADAVTICRDAFYSVDKKYGAIFDRLLAEGQTDVYPQASKRGGAFMSATTGLPTFVMLNHTDSFKSLETLAHEMGHAVHAECSKQLSPLYEDFSTTTAETASTLFEQLVQQKIIAQLSERDQYVFLHDKIGRDIATIQRQIACFNFEHDMHKLIRTQGLATKEELALLMTKNLRAYLGPAVDVSNDDGYSFVYWSHIRYGFYVYTYTYGILMSNLMARHYKKDKSYIKEIDTFLHAGGTDTVENIFKSIGIRADKIKTFEESLENQVEEIALLAKLAKKFN